MSFLATISGEPLSLIDPQPESIHLFDIAIGLSRECRFANQTINPICCAGHSMRVMDMCKSRESKQQAYLHDAPEAYLRDIPTPVKELITGYGEIEGRLAEVIYSKYGIEFSGSLLREVKRADERAGFEEASEWMHEKWFEITGLDRPQNSIPPESRGCYVPGVSSAIEFLERGRGIIDKNWHEIDEAIDLIKDLYLA